MMSKRQPVEKVKASAHASDALKEKLALTTRLLDFARDHLDMPSGGAYELYADLGREHLVWVVHAAPELSMQPKNWWYPVIGRQTYRGFFSEDLALREEQALRRDGYETWSDGVDAYSTLGVFRDPLLNTFIGREEMDLAELIFHELAHRRYHVSGDTRFNEGMAEAVAREGVKRWFVWTKKPAEGARYQERLRRLGQARQEISRAVAELKTIYASGDSDAEKREKKAEEIQKLRARLLRLRGSWGGGLDSWIHKTINNARLNAFTTYEDQVPRFQKLIDECGGDFPTFWTRVKDLRRDDKRESR